MQGRCYYCEKELTERTIKRHMKNCTEMKRVVEEKIEGSKGIRDQFIISLKDKYDTSTYCIYVSIDANLQLQHLDKFIRDIWVECCDHLSVFYINGESYQDNSDGKYEMNFYLKDVLSSNKKFEYQYDFGSTTYLILEVIDIITVPKTFSQIEIIARNNEVKNKCFKCDKPAKYINFNTNEWLCEECIDGMDEDELEEVNYCNSPRDGVCGYSGSEDNETPYLPQNNTKYKISRKKPKDDEEDEFDLLEDNYDGNELNFDDMARMFSNKLLDQMDSKNKPMDYNSFEEMMQDEFFKNYSKAFSKYANSYMDKFLKGKYSFDLEELIKSYPKKKINVLANNIGIKLPSSLNKSKSIEKYIDEYEKCIKDRMNVFNDDIYSVLRKYVKNGGVIYFSDMENDIVEDKHSYLMGEGMVFPCMKDEEPIFMMPQIMQEIIKEYDNIEFRRLLKRNSKIIKIFKGMMEAYGFLYFEDIKVIMKKYETDIDDSLLLNILEQGGFYDVDYYSVTDESGKKVFINEKIEDYEEILYEMDTNVDYSVISREELISMSDKEYLRKSSVGKKFMKEFLELFELDKEGIIDTMEALALDIQYRDNKEILDDVIMGIDEDIDKDDQWMVCNVINRLIKNVHIWKYKGATLNDREGTNKPIISNKLIGRNEPCLCGSGKKYKNCCGKNGNVIQLF